MVWVANAADVEDGPHDWVVANREVLVQMGFSVTDLDLRLYVKSPDVSALMQVLAQTDLLWVNGGNTFYLRWLLQASGADRLIAQAVQAGMVYGGGSAGAIVAGPTLNQSCGWVDVCAVLTRSRVVKTAQTSTQLPHQPLIPDFDQVKVVIACRFARVGDCASWNCGVGRVIEANTGAIDSNVDHLSPLLSWHHLGELLGARWSVIADGRVHQSARCLEVSRVEVF